MRNHGACPSLRCESNYFASDEVRKQHQLDEWVKRITDDEYASLTFPCCHFKKIAVVYSCLCEAVLELRSVTCHMGLHSVACHKMWVTTLHFRLGRLSLLPSWVTEGGDFGTADWGCLAGRCASLCLQAAHGGRAAGGSG